MTNIMNEFVQKLINFKDNFVARIKSAKTIKSYMFDLTFYIVLFALLALVFNILGINEKYFIAVCSGFVCAIANGIRRDINNSLKDKQEIDE